MSNEQKPGGTASRPVHRWSPGAQPTGSELSSEGSSAITDADVATAQEIPDTEEILELADRASEDEGHPRMHRELRAPTVDETEQPSEEQRRPHEMYEEGAWLKGE